MKNPLSARRLRYAAVTFAVALAALAGTLVWRSSADQQTRAERSRQQLLARVRDGVGSEVHFASSPGDNVHASVNAVAQFIHKRSRVQLDGATKNRLAGLEAETLAGARRRISLSELGEAMTATALARLASLSDAEIARLDQSLRGFDHPKLPAGFKRGRGLSLRVGHVNMMSSDEFTGQVKALRSQMGTPVGQVFAASARRVVDEEVGKKVSLFAEAVPQQFGGAGGAGGLTPLQALLVAYSVASEDHLTDSEANLNKRMAATRDGIVRIINEDYPAPDGHTAYGVNGYLRSSPLDIVFDAPTVNALLDRIAERSRA